MYPTAPQEVLLLIKVFSTICAYQDINIEVLVLASSFNFAYFFLKGIAFGLELVDAFFGLVYFILRIPLHLSRLLFLNIQLHQSFFKYARLSIFIFF